MIASPRNLSITVISSLLVIIVDLLLILRLRPHKLVPDLPLHLLANHIHHRVNSLRVLRHLLHHHRHPNGYHMWHHLWRHLLHHGLLHHLHHRLLLKNIYVVRIQHVIEQVIELSLANASAFQKVLTLVQIEAHVSSLHYELFLFVKEVRRDHTHIRTSIWAQG